MKKIVFLTLTVILIFGCSQKKERTYTLDYETVAGVRVPVYRNTGEPSQRSFTISPKKIFEIKGIPDGQQGTEQEFIWPRFLDVDKDGNIYVVDAVSSSVKKFDSSGRFIRSIGKEGNGPGEMKQPFMIIISSDSLFVSDYMVRRMVSFDLDGNFKNNIMLKGKLPYFTSAFGQDKFIGFLRSYEQKEDGIYGVFNLVLMNSQFEPVHTLRQFSAKIDPQYDDFLERYTPYAIGLGRIFTAENSEDVYRIKVTDFSGKLLKIIEKSYKKIAFNNDELDLLNQTFDSVRKRAGGQMARTIKAEYKKSIVNMFCDKEGHLLVASSVKRDDHNRCDFLVDVFQDGVFLNKIKLDIGKGYDFFKIHDEKIFFKGNRIYRVDEAAAVISVYNY